MGSVRGVVLVILGFSGTVQAAPEYDIRGLHVELKFHEAVNRAEALGGACVPVENRHVEGMVVYCDYLQCTEESCEENADSGSHFTLGSQPVVRVGLEAADAESSMTRISIVYEGDSELVERDLKSQYGKPYNDTSESVERSWSHARRLSWKDGRDKLGLSKTLKVVTLTRNPEKTPLPTEPANDI